MCNTASRLLTVCLTAIYLYRLSFVTHVTLKSGKIGGVEKKNYVGLKGVKNMCNMCICNTCTQKALGSAAFLRYVLAVARATRGRAGAQVLCGGLCEECLLCIRLRLQL